MIKPAHGRRLARHFCTHIRHAEVVCLDIRDDFAFMDDALVTLLEQRTRSHLMR